MYNEPSQTHCINQIGEFISLQRVKVRFDFYSHFECMCVFLGCEYVKALSKIDNIF